MATFFFVEPSPTGCELRIIDFLVSHQEKLQGKYDYLVEFASTPGGQLSYEKDFCGLGPSLFRF